METAHLAFDATKPPEVAIFCIGIDGERLAGAADWRSYNAAAAGTGGSAARFLLPASCFPLPASRFESSVLPFPPIIPPYTTVRVRNQRQRINGEHKPRDRLSDPSFSGPEFRDEPVSNIYTPWGYIKLPG